MKYLSLLKQNEKDLLASLETDLKIKLQYDYPADFAHLKSAFKDKFGFLTQGESNIVELSVLESQIKYTKQLEIFIKTAFEKYQKEIAEYKSSIEDALNNW